MTSSANDGVFRLLRRERRAPSDLPPVTVPSDQSDDDYWGSGAHPDVVQRLWDQLGKALPADSRALVIGSPALVHPQSGVVLAFALGTEYALRLPRGMRASNPHTDLRTVAVWSAGGSTDIVLECGVDWIFGSFSELEAAWCRQAYDECSQEAV